MTDSEAIRLRRSRRTYLPTSLPSEKIEKLKQMVSEINQTQGLGIRVVLNRSDLFGGFLRSYGLLKGVRHFLIMAGPSNNDDLFEKLGFFGEKIVLSLTKMNWGTCWVGGSFNRQAVGRILDEGEKLVAVIPFGLVPDHHTFRESLIHGSTHLKTRQMERFSTVDGTEPSWFQTAMDYVSRAPSAYNRLPSHFFVSGGKITCGLQVHDPICSVDLGIAKYHFACACPEGRWQFGETGEFIYR